MEAGLRGVIGKNPGVFYRGVLIPFAVDKQQRNFNGIGTGDIAMSVLSQHLIDVEMHLPVLVVGQAADMAVIKAFEQRWQVLADRAVDQATDIETVTRLEMVQAALQVIAHRRIDPCCE
ncbi:hypothetical protein D9M71_755650 [compost metagenome]